MSKVEYPPGRLHDQISEGSSAVSETQSFGVESWSLIPNPSQFSFSKQKVFEELNISSSSRDNYECAAEMECIGSLKSVVSG